ncbi:MAG: hypothetical protein R3C18_05570 [Planctomycetaceae bacterium]
MTSPALGLFEFLKQVPDPRGRRLRSQLGSCTTSPYAFGHAGYCGLFGALWSTWF